MIETLRGRVARLRSGYLARPYTSLQLLLLAGAVLLTFGVLMSVSTTISAATSNDGHGTVWTQMNNEILFIALGMPMLWLGARIPPRVYRMLVYPVLLLAVIMLLAVFAPHVGIVINDAHRWLKVGPMQIQPSEFAKFAMLVWAADLLARRHEAGDLARPGRILWPVLPGFVVVCALVMAEPDLGTTLCFLTILMGLLWTIGLPIGYFAGVLTLLIAMVTAVAVLDPRRLERLTSFMHPLKDTSNTGHQALQGLYALSSGGIFGVGLGAGPLKFGFVPNASSDYVFAIIGEELGLLGCLVVLTAFGLFAYAALRVARRSEDCFVRLAASGTAVWICGQALINIGYVTGLLPVTGIPLPFVSAGGTSLVLTMGVLGMLVSFARHEPEAVAAARADAAAGERSAFARWTRLGVPRVAVPVKARPPQARPAQARPAQARPAQARPAQARPAQARPAQVRPAKVRQETARPTTVREPRASKSRTAKPRPTEARPVSAQTANARRDSAQTANARRDSAQTANARRDSAQTANARRDSARTVNARRDSAQTANARQDSARTTQPRTARPRTAQPRTTQPVYRGTPLAAEPTAAQRRSPPTDPRRVPVRQPMSPRVRRTG